MSITYNITTNFASKDALPDNDPGKVIRGSDFSAEFTGIQTAFLTAAPTLNPGFTGTATFTSVDINGGAIDGTTIGANTKAAGSFTTVTATGLSTLPTVNIDGGAIDGTAIGTSVPSTINGTTITGTAINGPLTGNVTGNVVGNLTGNVTGNLTGNVTATAGVSSFNNVTINGSLDMVAGTSATITNLSAPVNGSDAATKTYVDTGIANLIDSAPGTLDTLNELAAALGDDANFATTTTNALATKLPLAGGTMTGNITFSSGTVTGLSSPVTSNDAATKGYVDIGFLPISGGFLSGTLDMGNNRIASAYVPVATNDLTNKLYVDGVAGSADAAAASAAAALQSENNAASSETAASNSATAALASETAAATLYDSFDDRYLGAKTSDPTLDNDGDALITGALYFNTTSGDMKVYNGSAWVDAYTSITGQTLDGVTTTGNTTTNAITVGNLTSTGIDDNATSTAITIDASQNVVLEQQYAELRFNGQLGQGDIGTSSGPAGGFYVANQYSGSGVNFKDSGSVELYSAAGNAAVGNLTIDSSGNVGIGTASPTYTLDVVNISSAYAPAGRFVSNGDATNWARVDIENVNATDPFILYQDQVGAAVLRNDANQPLSFSTNATERMRIDSSGNVGIGTNVPSERLTVAGSGTTARISITDTDTAAATMTGLLEFDGSDTRAGYVGYVGGNMELYTSVNDIRLSTGGSERLRIDSSGNVKIGGTGQGVLKLEGPATGTEGGQLDIECASGVGTYSIDTNSDDMRFLMTPTAGKYQWYCNANSLIGMTLDSSGNLTTAGNVTAYSDERLKDNVETLDGSKVYEMRGVSFTKDGEAGSGVIAQELQKIAPELVHEGEEYLSVAYGNLVGYLIEAVKELKAEIDQLKEAK